MGRLRRPSGDRVMYYRGMRITRVVFKIHEGDTERWLIEVSEVPGSVFTVTAEEIDLREEHEIF